MLFQRRSENNETRMKENWTYKKLGEVGTVIGGSTPKTDVAEFWNGDFAWITPAELDGSKYIHSTVRTITKEAIEKTNLTLLPVGTVLLSSRAPIGKVCITTIPMYCNQGFKNIVCSDKLNNEFLYWWLKGKNDYLNLLGVGATFKEISKRIVEQIIIPVPPIETQSRIVSELDLLQSIIDKQQAQLKELDKLAQSIFYDMFGDPVENEKGWEVKKVSEITKYYNGIAHEQDVDENGNFILINAKFISTQGETVKRTSMQRFPLFVDDIVMVLSDLPNGKSLGKCFLIDKNNLYSLNQRICCFRGFDGEAMFLKFVINRNPYFLSFDDGKGQTNLRKNDVENLPVIIPPLSLQKSFAAKIESIEKQKDAISQSIAETQKLFDYTMDKYFG